MARVGRDMRGPRARAEHVAQGAQPGQRPHGGLLRDAQERVPPPRRLVRVGLGEFMAALDEWMRWFRSGRISGKLGWLTPDEHRAALGYPVL